MSRLMWILHAIISTALMGVGVTAVLTMALPGWKPIALAAALGMALSSLLVTANALRLARVPRA